MQLQKCQYRPSLAVVNVTKWAILRHKDEESLKKAIAVIGPSMKKTCFIAIFIIIAFGIFFM